MRLAGHTVNAVSVGGLETCIELPEWKLCFDIGRCPPTATKLPRVLFTHAHTDHMGGIIHHVATRDLLKMPPPVYYLPAANEEPFRAMLEAWRQLDGSDLPCSIVPVKPGDVFSLGPGREIEVFRARHRVTAVGYALIHHRRTLLPHLHGATQAEIVTLRRAGETIDVPVRTVEVAFCGDTLIDTVDKEPLPRRARLLILETTFIDDKVSVEKARSQGHVHLDEVIERADLFENEVILMTHLSARYSMSEARRILDRRLPDALRDRVVLLPRLPPWEGPGRV